jgi:hypothetical protein
MKRCSAEQNEREDPQRERRLLAARPHAFAQKVRIERHERNDHDDGKDRKIGPKARDSDRAGSGEQCGGRRSVCAMVKLGPPSVSAARPLRRRKRNCRQHSAMSQSCQLRTHALQQKAPSFDDLVGAGEPRGRYGEAERLGRRREGSGDSVGSVSLAGIPDPLGAQRRCTTRLRVLRALWDGIGLMSRIPRHGRPERRCYARLRGLPQTMKRATMGRGNFRG